MNNYIEILKDYVSEEAWEQAEWGTLNGTVNVTEAVCRNAMRRMMDKETDKETIDKIFQIAKILGTNSTNNIERNIVYWKPLI